MKTIRTMSIIGIVLFSLCLLGMSDSAEEDVEAALGFGLIALLYGLAYAIVGVVYSKKRDSNPDLEHRLIKLHELKEKGILSEDEFQAKKLDLLRK